MHLFKPSRRKGGKAVKSPFYSGRYRLADEMRWRTVPLRVTDKEVAFRKLREVVTRAEREAAGMAVAKPLANAAQRSVLDHLQDFLADLSAKGRDAEYVSIIGQRVRRLVTECGWKAPKDITAESFIGWRSKNREKAAKTLNEYLNAGGLLLNWMVRLGKLMANPLAVVDPVKTQGQEVRKRRSFTVDELKRWLAVAGSRRPAYLAAAYTGLRRAELAALVVADVHLEGSPPFLAVRASTSKNSRSARIELHPELVRVFRDIIPNGAPGGQRVFARLPEVEELRADEGAAGIEFIDALGCRADFHSFRRTFTTLLAQAVVQRGDPVASGAGNERTNRRTYFRRGASFGVFGCHKQREGIPVESV